MGIDQKRPGERGFTMIEVLISVVVLTIGLVSLLAMFTVAIAAVNNSQEDMIAKQEAAGLIVSPSPVNTVNRKRLISIANESRVPAIFPFRFYVQDGALLRRRCQDRN